MIYFESLKLTTNNETSYYGLTLKLDQNKVNLITDKNFNFLKDLYYFFRQRKNYIGGRLFLDNYELSSLNEKDKNSFIRKNVSFLDDELINKNWTIQKITDFYRAFFRQNKNRIKIIFELCEFNFNTYKNTYIQNLTKYDFLKFQLGLAVIKNSKFIFINLMNDENLESSLYDELINIYKKMANKFNKEILVFVGPNCNNSDVIKLTDNIDKKKNSFTIIEEGQAALKEMNIRDFFNCIWVYLRFWWISNLSFWAINFALLFLGAWMIAINNIESINNHNQIINFAINNKIAWTILTYSIYIINLINMIIWQYFLNKKSLLLFSFMNGNGFGVVVPSLIQPIVITTMTFFNVVISITVNALIFRTYIMTVYWVQLNVFLYLFYLISLVFIMGININSKINTLTIRKILLNYINN